jgi:hypothetical protein
MIGLERDTVETVCGSVSVRRALSSGQNRAAQASAAPECALQRAVWIGTN